MSLALVLIALLLALCLLLLSGLSLAAYAAMVRRPVRDARDIEKRLLAKGEIKSEWLSLPWRTESVETGGGYALAVHVLEGRGDRLVILHHGITWNWLAALKYAAFLVEAGYGVLAFDARGHGESGGRGSSFGVFEARDLEVLARWAGRNLPSARLYALLGISLGAAAALQCGPLVAPLAVAAGVGPGGPADGRLEPVAIIADCAFSGADAILLHRLSRFGVPPFLRPAVTLAVDWLCRSRRGFSIFAASPARAALATSLPILFIHGAEDDYVPTAMSVSMFKARKALLPAAASELLLLPGAGHAKSHRKDPAVYEGAVLAFLDRAFEGPSSKPVAGP